jgi:hypothetical protein
LLNPKQVYKNDDKDCLALAAVKDYYENRSTSPRIYRNTIAFLAPDSAMTDQLTQDMRMLMAWRSIDKDTANLNLDNAQQREVKDNIQHIETAIRDRLREAYSWLILPAQDGAGPVTWSVSRISGLDNPVSKAAQKMRDDESILDALSPKILSMEMSQFKLWRDKDHIQVRELWEDYTKYVYLHRVKNQSVLFKTLESGIKSGEYFGYADGQDMEGRYEALIFGPSSNLFITLDGLLVKPEIARRQIDSSIKPSVNTPAAPPHGDLDGASFANDPAAPPTSQPTAETRDNHFFGTVKLPDLNKIANTTGDINLKVLQLFSKLTKSNITVKLDIEARIPDGVSDDFKKTVIENCIALQFETREFDKE